jgi:2-hydroxychromene-2-carboxylate isomerase
MLAGVRTLEFFFDCSSPWTYLAFEAVQPLASDPAIRVIWKPILVGGIFNTVNPSVYDNRTRPVPAKARYYAKDLADWARRQNIAIGQPLVFPVNSVKVMRGAFVAIEQDRLVPYARRAFQRYWGELADISKDEEVRRIAIDAGLDGNALLAELPNHRHSLKANTDELIARGGFGSPTMFVDGSDMYFGNDRVVLVEAALRR